MPLTYATGYLIAYAEPGGPEFIRGMRDRRRRLIPAEPGRRGWARGRDRLTLPVTDEGN